MSVALWQLKLKHTFSFSYIFLRKFTNQNNEYFRNIMANLRINGFTYFTKLDFTLTFRPLEKEFFLSFVYSFGQPWTAKTGQSVCWIPVRECVRILGRGASFWRERDRSPKRGQLASVEPRQGRWKDVTEQNEEMEGGQGRIPLHGFRTRACTE
jgi:hypothetical protein